MSPAAPKPPKRKKKPRKPIRRSRVRQRAGKPKRFAQRRDADFVEWVRSQPCIIRGRVFKLGIAQVPHNCLAWFDSEVECCHVKTRATGGLDKGNCVSMCGAMHRRQHSLGIRSFEKAYDVDLKQIAIELAERYDRERSVG